MIQAMLAKKVLDIVLKRVMQKREIKKLRKYVEQPNELDIQMKQAQKTIAKQGKYIEEVEKDIAILKKDSHPRADWICMKCGCTAKKYVKKKRRK